MKIEIAGPGCQRCKTTEKNVIEAVKSLGIDAKVSHVYDIREYAKMGVTITPAVIVDGKVRISGRIPSVDEIKEMLTKGK